MFVVHDNPNELKEIGFVMEKFLCLIFVVDLNHEIF